MKSIFILLTASETYISKVIKLTTADTYTHISLSFDASLNTFYSFARKKIDVPLPAGLMKEHLYTGYFGKYSSTPCALYEIKVDDDSYLLAKNMVESMYAMGNKYHYSIIGLLLCRFSIPLNRENHYFCSQFVGEILEKSGAAILPKPTSLMRPADYLSLQEAVFMYEGTIGSLLAEHVGVFQDNALSV